MKTVLAPFVFALAASSAAAEEGTDYWEGDGWTVSAYASNCIASTISEHREDGDWLFGVYWDARDKYLTLNFTSNMVTSLEDDEEVTAELLFTSAHDADDGWGSPKFTVKKLDDGKPLFVMKVAEGSIPDMITDISRYERIGLWKNDTMFAGAHLGGSAAAMVQLKKCAFGVAGLNPKDPFAQ